MILVNTSQLAVVTQLSHYSRCIVSESTLKKKKAILWNKGYLHGPWHSLGLFPTQDTLAYATALLNEKDQSGSSNGSESSPANENGERHLQQVTTTKACLSCVALLRYLVPGARVRTIAEFRTAVHLTKVTCHVFISSSLVCIEGLRVSYDDRWTKKWPWWGRPVEDPIDTGTDQLKHLMPGTYWNWSPILMLLQESGREAALQGRRQCWRRLFPWKPKAFF